MEEKNIDVNVVDIDDEAVDKLIDRYYTLKKKRRKIILIATAAVLLVAVVVSLIVYLVNKTSYRAAVSDFMDAYTRNDSSAVLDMSSSFYSARKQHGISILETVTYLKKIITNAHENFKANLGENYEITYDITSVDRMRDEEFESMLQSLTFGAYNPGLIITDAVRVEINVTAKAETALNHVITLLLTKEDGEWCVLDIK